MALSPFTRRLLPSLLAAVLAVLVATPAHAENAGSPALLRGPHPFLKENTLSVSGGLATATGDAVSGLRAQVGYGYELIGSLWLNLHMAMVDGSDAPVDTRPCSRCGTAAEIMGGLSYRFRMNVPIIPYAGLSAGFLYVFPDQGLGAMGLGVRPTLGARYYLFDWLGFGLEIGSTLGFVGHDDQSGLENGTATLDFTIGGEWQF